MKEDAQQDKEIKEIIALVRNLFYEVTYVYYYIKRNLKPDDQSKIKKLVDSKLQDLLSKNECGISILSKM